VLDWGPDPPMGRGTRVRLGPRSPHAMGMGTFGRHAWACKTCKAAVNILRLIHEGTAVMRPPATSTVAPGCSVELVAGDVQLL